MEAFPILYAFAVGMLSFLAPCSIAMLPAYISYFLGRGTSDAVEEPAKRSRWWLAIAASGGLLVLAALIDTALIGSGLSAIGPRQGALMLVGTALLVGAGLRAAPGQAAAGVRLGLAVAAGILAVFGLLGLPLYGLLHILDFRSQTYLVIAVAAAMILVGLLGLAGKDLSVTLPIRAPEGRRTASFATFGVAYGLVSMGCNLPLFLAAALGPFLVRADPIEGIAALLAYGGGMALLMIALTVSLAVSRGLTEQRVRRLVPKFKVAGNVVLILAGAYIAYYDWTVLRLTA